MGHHTFDADDAATLEEAADRYRYVSREELLWALSPDGTETVADLGSGTGFYTDDVAPRVDRVYAVDVQAAMQDYYRVKGRPGNVSPVTADVADLPFDDDHLDAALSTMTYHEFASADALAELARVLDAGGRPLRRGLHRRVHRRPPGDVPPRRRPRVTPTPARRCPRAPPFRLPPRQQFSTVGHGIHV